MLASDFPGFSSSPLDKLRQEVETQGASFLRAQALEADYLKAQEMETYRANYLKMQEIEAKKTIFLGAQEMLNKHSLNAYESILQKEVHLTRESRGVDYAEQAMQALKAMDAYSPRLLAQEEWLQTLKRDSFGIQSMVDAVNKMNGLGAYAHAQLALDAEQAWRNPLAGIQDGLSHFLQPLAYRSLFHVLDGLPTDDILGSEGHADDEMREQAVAVVEQVAFSAANAINAQELVNQIVAAIAGIKDTWLQKVLLQVFWPLIAAIIASIVATLSTDYIKRPSESPQQAAKGVKSRAMQAGAGLESLGDYRYVGSTVLMVRETAHANGPIIGQLKFGQLVRVVEKGHDFTLVSWSNADGSVVIRGWVFSRYLRKFS